MRLLAEEVGHVSIHLCVVPSPGSNLQMIGNVKLDDDIQIQVCDWCGSIAVGDSFSPSISIFIFCFS